MNKRHLLFVLFLFCFFISCSVNYNTGLLVLTNLSGKEIKNIKVGDTLLTFSLLPGVKFDYWFFSPLQGKITTLGIDKVTAPYLAKDNGISYIIAKENCSCFFKLYYEYHLYIKNEDSKKILSVEAGYSADKDKNSSTQFDFPAE